MRRMNVFLLYFLSHVQFPVLGLDICAANFILTMAPVHSGQSSFNVRHYISLVGKSGAASD